MKRFLVVLMFMLGVPLAADAHVPVLPVFTTYEDIQTITEPAVSRAFYAELQSFPHRYVIQVPEDQKLFAEILVPDIAEATNDIGGIIIKKINEGRYEEVTRFDPVTATWESFYEPFGGDSYRRGPSFEADVTAGEYLVEISNATNAGKYVFVVGRLEDFSEVGIFETMKRIYQVKQFYGKSPIAVLQSPFYAVPFAVLVVILGIIWYRRRRVHA